MTEPDVVPSPSLMQQRHALRRSTITWTVLLVGQSLCAVGYWVSLVFDASEWYKWVAAIAFSVLAIASITILRTVRRKTRRFEERPGRDAGRQR